jgi:hypothetical protein
MSISRQFGVHEVPGTEEEAPRPRREVSAAFEANMRDYVSAIWAKLGELEGKIEGFEAWRDEIAHWLRVQRSPGPVSLVSSPPPHPPKPWETEGMSRRTWYRKRKEADHGGQPGGRSQEGQGV